METTRNGAFSFTFQRRKYMEGKYIIAVKREKPIFNSYLDNENKNEYVSGINRSIFYYNNFTTKIDIKRCEVFKIRFDQGFGSELNGYHFVVAMQSSKETNQTITVVPLSSLKEAKNYNKKSTIYIGEIPEMPNGKEAVALINQIRTIDKIRLIGAKALDNFVDKVCEQIKDFTGEKYIQYKEIYRLTEEQYKKILYAVNNYLFVGSVERKHS